MSYTSNIYNYPATETADLIFGEGVSNENSADIARTSSIVSNAPAGTDFGAIRAYVDAVHGSNTEYQTAATRIGGPPPKIWEFLRLKR